VDFSLGHRKDGPVNVWQHFEREFVSCPMKVPYEILVLNSSYGKATAWFDDIRIEEVR
jgi:hypothetical protein